MRVCLISVEIFAWGKHGGFGRATRIIGRELSRKGVDVTAIVPRRKGQGPIEVLDGIRILSFKPYDLKSAMSLFREVEADIYHSEEPSFGTFLAMQSMPEKKHVITFRDPRNLDDWLTELRLPSLNKAQVVANWMYEDNWLVKQTVRRADGLFAAAKMIIPKARKKYHLKSDPEFLPTPVEVPEKLTKAPDPTVCFISRWDKRKRPEIFFELAKSFPDVQFLAAGKSRDPDWDKLLHDKYGHLPNLKMLGFVDQFRSNDLAKLLERSWVLINTAAREGLPNAFIEAAAYKCSILSAVDPDGFATQFGYLVRNDDFVTGLNSLLEGDLWQKRASAGYDYVRQVFAIDKAINQHLSIYRKILSQNRQLPIVEIKSQ